MKGAKGMKKKILIVDDEAPIRKLLTKLLEPEGYEIFEASNGDQGLDLVHSNRPDLVIIDLIMPGKEGLETIREIHKLFPDVKMVAMSGGGLGDPGLYLNLAIKMGAQLSFQKPMNHDFLVSTVKDILS